MTKDKVLLIDDEKGFLEVLSQRLESRGLDVQTARSGEEALFAVQEHTFDAVVLDLAMPGLDGIETLRQLKKISPNVQVILLTGYATVEKSIEVMKLGALDLLEKPADFQTLLEKIEEASLKHAELREKRVASEIDDILRKRGW